ncbi:MAG: lasso peptide biosynthesis B2 protein [Caulobacteraceae bacterium]
MRRARDTALASEALAWVALAGLGLRLAPFRWIAAAANRKARVSASDEAGVIDKVRWAVTAAARRSPWRPACFEEGLAAHAMLRRRGVASVLYYGARRGGAPGLAAHVWVRAGGQDVVGGAGAGDFAILAAWPAAGERV